MKKAFTLSEVLIALAVIGVVAALTMPSLLQRSEEKIIVSGLQKSIAILDAGFRKIMAEERVSDIRYTDFYRDSGYWMADHPTFKKQFKTINAGQHEYINPFRGHAEYMAHGCLEYIDVPFDDEYWAQYPDQEPYEGTYNTCREFGSIQRSGFTVVWPDHSLNSYVPVTLSNNMNIWVFENTYDSSSYPIIIYVDTNGKRGPNRFAYDVQRLGVKKDGHVVPVQTTTYSEYNIGSTRIKRDGWKLNYTYEY